jgi:tetratricopeptide (TPR) repeat protein
MKTLRIITVAVLLAAVAVSAITCGGGTSVAMRSGKVYFHQSKDYARAAEWFRKAIAEEPTNWEAHYYLAMSLAYLGQFGEAGQEFIAAYDLAPPGKKEVVDSNQQAIFAEHFRAGNTAKDTGSPDVAAAEFEKAVAVDPKEPNGYINLAFVYRQLGQPDRALEVMKKSVEVDSTSFYAWSNLGAAYKDNDEIDLAAAAYQRVIDLKPTDQEVAFGALAQLGDITFERKDYTKALEYYARAAEIETEDAALHYQVGASNYQLGNFPEAVSGFARCADLAREKDPGLYSDAMFNLGLGQIRMKDYDAAISTLETLLAVQETADLHDLLGRAYSEKGLKEKAIEEFKKAEALRGK